MSLQQTYRLLFVFSNTSSSSVGVKKQEALSIHTSFRRLRMMTTINESFPLKVKPVLDELGIPTPEDLGYDKPELFKPQTDGWWEKKW